MTGKYNILVQVIEPKNGKPGRTIVRESVEVKRFETSMAEKKRCKNQGDYHGYDFMVFTFCRMAQKLSTPLALIRQSCTERLTLHERPDQSTKVI